MEKFLYLLAIIMVAVIVGFILDYSCGTWFTSSGSVIDKQYEAEKSSIGTGISTGGNAVVTSSHEDEKFLLMIEDETDIYTVEVTNKEYYKIKVGQTVVFNKKIGFIFKSVVSTELVKY